MEIFDRFFGFLASSSGSPRFSSSDDCSINPANGLPMVGGCGGLDIHGNPYGCNGNDLFASSSSFDDSWTSSSSFGGIDSFGHDSGFGSRSFDSW